MKLLKMAAALSILSGSLIAACGGSSSNNPPGTGGDSGTPVADSGGSPTDGASQTDASDAGPTFTCTATSCGASQSCCFTQTGSTCIAPGAPCKGASVSCQDSTTCKGGAVCCGTLSLATFSATSACQSAPCATGAYQVCASSAECLGGETCQAIVLPGIGPTPIKSCQAATDGGATDSGADSGTDTGIADASDAG